NALAITSEPVVVVLVLEHAPDALAQFRNGVAFGNCWGLVVCGLPRRPGRLRRGFGGRELGEGLAVVAACARVGTAEPEISGLVFEHAIDGGAAEAVLLRVCLEGFAVIAARAAASVAKTPGMPEPEVARPVGDHRPDKIVQQPVLGRERRHRLA